MKATKPQNSPYQLAILAALGGNTYAGTVPVHVVAKRRAKNRAARAARRVNRKR